MIHKKDKLYLTDAHFRFEYRYSTHKYSCAHPPTHTHTKHQTINHGDNQKRVWLLDLIKMTGRSNDPWSLIDWLTDSDWLIWSMIVMIVWTWFVDWLIDWFTNLWPSLSYFHFWLPAFAERPIYSYLFVGPFGPPRGALPSVIAH